MYYAVQGCTHGELDCIYDAIIHIQETRNIKISALLCCGDFESMRNEEDLATMACPDKYKSMKSFYKYYTGEKVAPCLTIFIGGNHEASNYLQELPFGGWVAKNIYYLGYASVIKLGDPINGIRIGGLSGIWKPHDYHKGHYEKMPYDENSKRSAYHIRQLEIFRLNQINSSKFTEKNQFDIFLTHDWPKGIYEYGDVEALVRRKPHFQGEIDTGTLGSPPASDVLYKLKPKYWFSAHLHVKFSAVVGHANGLKTKFLALDKCLPNRSYLQVLEMEERKPKSALGCLGGYSDSEEENEAKETTKVEEPIQEEPKPKVFKSRNATIINENGVPNNGDSDPVEKLPTPFSDLIEMDNGPGIPRLELDNLPGSTSSDSSDIPKIYHDAEWLTILRKTGHLWSSNYKAPRMPTEGIDDIFDYTPSKEEIIETSQLFNDDLEIRPEFFIKTCPAANKGVAADFNPQTYEICEKLDMCHGEFGMPKKSEITGLL